MAERRFRLNELSVGRLFGAGKRRLQNIPELIAWRRSTLGKQSREFWRSCRNKHAGERCFVIANGPSLLRTDLSLLRNEVTFGMNRIYLHFPRMGFETTYLCVSMPLVIEEFRDDFNRLRLPSFCTWEARRFLDHDPVAYFKLRLGWADRFEGDLTKPISSGATVTYSTLQIAYHMGFRDVVLVGLDHRFAAGPGKPNIIEKRTEAADTNHFHPGYFPPGSRWGLPDLTRSTLAYAQARRAFESAGGSIRDATVGGACKVFPKVRLEDVC